uniref:BRX domain-containing protein n=1 Tax=Aegilops tauschii subsp. strangulata TaxID=200361 RepID=A0A453CUR3_AEGTS
RGGSTRDSPVVMMPPPPPSSSSSKDPMSRSVSCKAMMPPPSGPYGAGPSTRAAYYPSAAAVPDPSDHVWAHHFNMLNSAAAGGHSSYDPSRATTSSRDEASVSISNVSDMEATEWIEQDEPGVCLTIRELGDGTRELRRVRFRYICLPPMIHELANLSPLIGAHSYTLDQSDLMHILVTIFSAGRGLARTGRRCGGSRTETEYRRSICS